MHVSVPKMGICICFLVTVNSFSFVRDNGNLAKIRRCLKAGKISMNDTIGENVKAVGNTHSFQKIYRVPGSTDVL